MTVRQNSKNQQPLTPAWADHEHSRELRQISDVLDENPHLADLAAHELAGGKRMDVGRDGMTGEQALRIGMLKRIHRLSYEELSFHVQDSATFRTFARLPLGHVVKVSTLKSNVKRLSPEIWEAVNKALLKKAIDVGIEKGRKTRTDCTPVESNIHDPTDSSLLSDCVRVVTRIMKKAKELFPDETWIFRDHTRRAKKRDYQIQFPSKKKEPKKKQREKNYRDLVKVSEATYGYGSTVLKQLRQLKPTTLQQAVHVQSLEIKLQGYLQSTERVLDQTRRRVFHGEKVPAKEKLVSIFETHTDIIKKDNHDPIYGHKICLTGGASSMILDCVIEDGNPADSTLVKRTIERQKDLYGRPPRQASFDGAFASSDNLKAAKDAGVKDVAFHKKCALKVTDMVKSAWVFKQLRNFRAGIEGCISTLKRAFEMDRCDWRGLGGFKSYVWSSVVSFNAIVLARHLLARA